jgi:hypothetical protein
MAKTDKDGERRSNMAATTDTCKFTSPKSCKKLEFNHYISKTFLIRKLLPQILVSVLGTAYLCGMTNILFFVRKLLPWFSLCASGC